MEVDILSAQISATTSAYASRISVNGALAPFVTIVERNGLLSDVAGNQTDQRHRHIEVLHRRVHRPHFFRAGCRDKKSFPESCNT